MPTSKIESDVFVDGNLRAKTLSIPEGTVDDDAVKADAGVAATKLQHQHVLTYRQPNGSDVTAAIVPIFTVRGVSATVVEVEVVAPDAPDGGDKKFTVDLKKASQASPTPASVLQSVIDYDSTKANYEVVQGTIQTSALADGDTLLVDVAVSGTTGNQAQGLVVTITVREDAE